MSRWREKETKRLNERSMRRAIVASVLIVGLLYWWLAESIPPHATPLGISGETFSRFIALTGHRVRA